MDDTMGEEGINKLAHVLQERAKEINRKPAIIDFGVINNDMSLTTNRFPVPIPKSDYVVCRQLTLGPTNDILAKTQDIGEPHSGSHIHNTMNLTCSSGGAVSGTVGEQAEIAPDPPDPSQRTAGDDSSDGMHEHHVLIPEKMRKLKPGDRVLVVWVDTDVCIVDIILPGSAL